MYISSKYEKFIILFDSPFIIQVVSNIFKSLCLGLRVMSFSKSADVADAITKKLCSQQHMTLIKMTLLSQRRKTTFINYYTFYSAKLVT